MVHRLCLPITVHTPRSTPVSSPDTLSPKPKRSPWCGLCFGKKPTLFWLFPTRCTLVGVVCADPELATIATMAIAAAPATRATGSRAPKRENRCLDMEFLPPSGVRYAGPQAQGREI